MIQRKQEMKNLQGLLKRHRVVGIFGARQVGKTTLARNLAKAIDKKVIYFDLENPEDQSRLADPMLALKELKG
jgi:predicted AAA+ superfamily ATPase